MMIHNFRRFWIQGTGYKIVYKNFSMTHFLELIYFNDLELLETITNLKVVPQG